MSENKFNELKSVISELRKVSMGQKTNLSVFKEPNN